MIAGGRMSRLTKDMTIVEAVKVIGNGSPGSLKVLYGIYTKAEHIDPYELLGALGYMLMIDAAEMYDEKVWQLYNDVCRNSISLTMAMIKTYHLRMIDRRVLDLAIDNRGQEIDISNFVEKFEERFPRFQLSR